MIITKDANKIMNQTSYTFGPALYGPKLNYPKATIYMFIIAFRAGIPKLSLL